MIKGRVTDKSPIVALVETNSTKRSEGMSSPTGPWVKTVYSVFTCSDVFLDSVRGFSPL